MTLINRPSIITAKPPRHPRQPGWPHITRRIVGRDSEPLTAMELTQAAERVRKGRRVEEPRR